MEEERSPDLYYSDQLMTGSYDQDDEELYKVILQSRREYLEQEKLRKQVQLNKEQLQKQLAVPLSRLKLWQKTTLLEEEKLYIHYILQILSLKTSLDEEQEHFVFIPPEHVQPFKTFLSLHFKASNLYKDVYKVCIEYLSFIIN